MKSEMKQVLTVVVMAIMLSLTWVGSSTAPDEPFGGGGGGSVTAVHRPNTTLNPFWEIGKWLWAYVFGNTMDNTNNMATPMPSCSDGTEDCHAGPSGGGGGYGF